MNSSARLKLTKIVKLQSPEVKPNGDGPQQIPASQQMNPKASAGPWCVKWTSDLLLLLQLWSSDGSKSKRNYTNLERDQNSHLFCISAQFNFPWLSLLQLSQEEPAPPRATQNVWTQFLLRGIKCAEQSHRCFSFTTINQRGRGHENKIQSRH